MIYYKLIMKCRSKESPKVQGGDEEDPVREKIVEQLKAFNEKHFEPRIDRKSEFAFYFDEGKIYAAIMRRADSEPGQVIAGEILEKIRSMEGIIKAEIETVEEITAVEMKELYDEAVGNELFAYSPRRYSNDRVWNFLFSPCGFEMEEEIAEDSKLSYSQARELLDSVMADRSLRQEIDRIYDEGNAETFYGYPVHYRISAGNLKAAMDIARLMVRALYSRKRIPGTRITSITEIELVRHDADLEKLIQNSGGTAVVVDTYTESEEGRFATDLTRTANLVSGYIKKNCRDTLFFIYQNNEDTGFGNDLVSRLETDMDFIELKEGRGDSGEARAYMKRVIEGSRYRDLMDGSAYSYLKNKKSYHASDVRSAVDEWERMCLKEKAYTAYGKCVKKKHRKKQKEKKDAYAELQKMIGLDRVKEMVDDILSFYRLQKARKKYVKEEGAVSRHMVFTGNPGCAKTTVARLIAQILLEEGIITSGNFVECGRADLVGKYVGWTAKAVRERFRKAKGGVLFIDEAYSLVDSSNSFGDEAINTIVQEMENHRDDVIVIFAGYPGPMKEFINRNEGLKSRIAFHVDFPDYNEDEMLQILSLMAKDRGFTMDVAGQEKCRGIFREAVRCENFGNGRFARNLLEHAMMRQAGRLSKKGLRKDYSKETITRLVADDFENDLMSDSLNSKGLTIGF